MNPHKQLTWKARGAEFHDFQQPETLKAWSSEGQHAWLWKSSEETEAALVRKTGKQPTNMGLYVSQSMGTVV